MKLKSWFELRPAKRITIYSDGAVCYKVRSRLQSSNLDFKYSKSSGAWTLYSKYMFKYEYYSKDALQPPTMWDTKDWKDRVLGYQVFGMVNASQALVYDADLTLYLKFQM